MDDLASGTLYAGRYAVVRLLGRGAVKQVYLAYDRLTQTQVALARLADRFGADASVGARFSREARASSALTSPFTVRVFDAGKTADGERYLVSEAVLGRGLDAALATGPVAPAAAATWAAEVLSALEEAHARGLVHRDVKPENVMLAPAAGDPVGEVARLMDFGLAKILDQSLEGSVAVHTAAGVVMGTPDYMSPEQWAGAALDGRADLYAVGVMLYEMLLGRPPFEAPTLLALAALHCHAEVPPFPADAAPMLAALEPVVRRALAKRPEQRWPSAVAMRAAIESASGVRLPTPPTVRALIPDDDVLDALDHVELMCDAGVGPVQVLATPRLFLGRTGHIVARCLPPSDDNDRRARSVSRRHARVDWHGGYATLADLRSASGTSLNGRSLSPGGEPSRLEHGDEIGLGPHVRFLFEHAATSPGALPAWARLTRLDRHALGVSHVLVLTEATVSRAHDAAIVAPRDAHDATLILRARNGRLVALRDETEMPVELFDGQRWQLGDTTWTVAMPQQGVSAR
ncbi:MAG: FHA domain-containing serine/threonine-protein kinase [Deltaproteobacteria bacterium]|nr:FHA domain-containing serine/threonine-protein kinase [Myxococcales bacterium]MDP3220741.1 FHA domain-containing serine/threonine-protein kinase [Deltaproteobacteria bacterium]